MADHSESGRGVSRRRRALPHLIEDSIVIVWSSSLIIALACHAINSFINAKYHFRWTVLSEGTADFL